MKVYDIALVLIRTLVAVELIRETVGMIFGVIGVSVSLAILQPTFDLVGQPGLKTAVFNSIYGPASSIAVSLLIFAASRRIARFAAKLATPQDAATTLH